MSWYSPRGSYRPTRARTSTASPSFGRNFTAEFRWRHIAQRTWAWLSLSVKYQCPEAGAAKFDNSASSHNRGMPDSSSSRTSLLSRETV
jgi:hypothetical protein